MRTHAAHNRDQDRGRRGQQELVIVARVPIGVDLRPTERPAEGSSSRDSSSGELALPPAGMHRAVVGDRAGGLGAARMVPGIWLVMPGTGCARRWAAAVADNARSPGRVASAARAHVARRRAPRAPTRARSVRRTEGRDPAHAAARPGRWHEAAGSPRWPAPLRRGRGDVVGVAACDHHHTTR